MTDRNRFWREALLTIGLPLAAAVLNYIGMGYGPLTWGRGLGLIGYGLLSIVVCFRGTNLLWKAVRERKWERTFLAGLGILAVYFLLVWPFTFSAGRLNDLLYREKREETIRMWMAGELRQVSSNAWYVGDSSWSRKLWTTGQGVIIFDIYNGIYQGRSIAYSPQSIPDWNWVGECEDLDDGWYWISERYY